MLRIVLVLTWMLASSAFAREPSMIRVRMSQAQASIKINGWGLRLLGETPELRSLLTHLTVSRQPSGQGWELLWEKAGQSKKQFLASADLNLVGERLARGPMRLPNRLRLFSSSNKIDIVGVLPLENYIVGVISSEMPLGWPLEALKAQAIAARSYALAVARERRGKPYDVESTISDQVFNHVSGELDEDPQLQKARRAVSQTQGVVLLDQKEKVLKAYYHSQCGGQTSSEKMVWGSGQSSVVVLDSYCQNSKKSNWSFSISKEALAKKLRDRLGWLAQIEQVLPVRQPSELRAQKVRLLAADGASKVMSANEFREMIGYSDLRSTYFFVKASADDFSFVGKGWGHGVGLCQWGTRRMAEIGSNSHEILKHYYPAARLSVPEI